jgi:hypothetical protein
MKGRSGFVSNSSTASFVLLGFDASGIDLDPEEIDDLPFAVLWGDEDGCPAGVERVIGKYLFRCSSDDWATSEVESLDDYIRDVERLHDRYGAQTPIMLWSGMQAC